MILSRLAQQTPPNPTVPNAIDDPVWQKAVKKLKKKIGKNKNLQTFLRGANDHILPGTDWYANISLSNACNRKKPDEQSDTKQCLVVKNIVITQAGQIREASFSRKDLAKFNYKVPLTWHPAGGTFMIGDSDQASKEKRKKH